MERNCGTCKWNEDGFCDLKGLLVDDEDSCKKYKSKDEE